MFTMDLSSYASDENVDATRYDNATSSDIDVRLYFCHGKIFVWKPTDAKLIRENYRIVGSCVGCFPQKPRQNAQLGLPVLFSNIEAKFILEHKGSHLVDSSMLPSAVDLNKHQQKIETERKTQYEIQTKLKQEQKLLELDEMASNIAKGKLDKSGRRRAAKQHQRDGSVMEDTSSQSRSDEIRIDFNTESGNTANFGKNDFEKFKELELKKVERYGTEQTWVKLPVQSPFEYKYATMQASDLKLTEEETLKYSVFCDLHNQGYFITDGVKFGGHFLVYPGDPGIYHSSYIVLCVPINKKLQMTDYSALGRLATSVKKTLLLCSVDENNEVIYSSIAWSGVV